MPAGLPPADPNAGESGALKLGMEDFGVNGHLVRRLIERAGSITMEEAADLYRAQAARTLLQGSEAMRLAVVRGRTVASRAHLEPEYERARHVAASAWRHALPETQGPWLLTGQAIANAAGALVVSGSLDDKTFQLLTGAWRQAIGWLEPVGPGLHTREHALIG
jgi:hypothetical protein